MFVGATERFACALPRAGSGAAHVRVAVVLDRLHREVPLASGNNAIYLYRQNVTYIFSATF